MRKQAEDSAKEAKDELAMFKSDAVWRQRAREGALAREETFSVRRSLHHLSACAVEVVLLIRNSIDKGMIDDLKAHADRVPKEVMLHDKTIKQDVLLDEKSIKQDDPHNTSVTNEPASSLHARVRQQSRGNLRGAKGEFHLTIYSPLETVRRVQFRVQVGLLSPCAHTWTCLAMRPSPHSHDRPHPKPHRPSHACLCQHRSHLFSLCGVHVRW